MPAPPVRPLHDAQLAPYVPVLAAEWISEDADSRHRRVSGTMAFVDISGFTSLTERLTRMGKVGSEELSDILDSTFGALLEQTRREGADLVKWGGDAVLLLFRGEDHAARAVRATAAMRHALYSVGRTRSSAGTVTLRMSVGIHSGDFDFYLVGDPEIHRELIVSGPAASRTAELEAAASAGQIAVGAETAALLPRSAVADNGDGLLLLRRAPRRRAEGSSLAGTRDGTRAGTLDGTLDGQDPERPMASSGTEVTGGIAGLIPPPVRAHLQAAAGESEHRTIAVAFIQFSGTDALTAEEGPAALADALDEVVRNVQSACAAHDVTFLESDINRDGGKIMLVAGAPGGGEDVERRMLGAVRLVLDRAGRLPLRVGVNRGRVFASDFGPAFRRTYSVKGDAINVAARVMGKAQPGHVLAVRDVVVRAGASVAAVEVQPFHVKGKRRPIHAALVTAAGDDATAARSGRAGMHGRENEVAALSSAFTQVRDGKGRWVEIIADPGMGKSSLVDTACELAPDYTVVHGTSGHYGGAAAHQAIRRLLREVIGASPTASPETLETALLAAIRRFAPHLEPSAPLLATVLGFTMPETPELRDLDERFRPARLSRVVVELLAGTLTTPTVLLFEGADRMDESSTDIVRDLIREAPEHPWLILSARRPDPGGLASDDADDVERIRLEPLDEQASLALLESLTAEAPMSAHILRALAAKAGGNPLFLRALLDAARTSGEEDLPDSIDSLIGSQIDQLAPRARTLLRFAAVLGERFRVDDLHEMVAADGWTVTPTDLEALSGFIEREGPVEGWFRFRNALIQEVAYAGLPYRLRRTMHARVGEVLERTGDPEALSERLSTHFYEAADYSRAWTYSRMAGEHARSAYSYPEAMAFYDRALTAARNSSVASDELARLQEAKGDVAELAGLTREAVDAYRRAKKLVRSDVLALGSITVKETRIHQRLGAFVTAIRISSQARARLSAESSPEAAGIRAMLASRVAHVNHLRSRRADAVRWSEVAVREARESNDPSALALAYNYREVITAALGLRPEEPYGELALASYTAAGDLLGQGHCLNNLAIRSLAEGAWQTALSRLEDATELFRRVGDTANEANALYGRADVLQRQARYAEAVPLLLAARRGALVNDDPELVALVDRELGKVRLGQGRASEARELLTSAQDALAGLDLAHEVIDARQALVQCLLIEGDVESARTEASALLADAVAAGADRLIAGIHWLRGTTLTATGEWPAAEAAFEAGRDVTGDWDGGHMYALNLLGLAQVAPHLGRDRTEELAEARAVLDRLGVRRLPAPFAEASGPGLPELAQ